MGKHQFKFYQISLAFVDFLLIHGGIIIAFWMVSGREIPEGHYQAYLVLLPWISLGALVVFNLFDLYAHCRRRRLHHLIYSMILSILIINLAVAALSFIGKEFAFPVRIIVLSALTQMFLLAVFRSGVWFVSKQLFGKKKVLIIDQSIEHGIAIYEKFLNHDQGWFEVEDLLLVQEWHVNARKVDQVDVILVGSALSKPLQAEIMNCCSKKGKEVLIVPELFELFLLESELQQIDDLLVLSVRPPRLSPNQLIVKRLFDLALSSVMLILLSPIMIVLYFLVKFTSPGPAIYKQERLGLDGKVYNIYKYRSMVQDAETRTGPVFASDKDPRITSLGRFMRSTRLDEIPQLFNVLNGDMSLVGPRPERPFFTEQFKQSLPDYTYRLSVKPGITGLAQVMAKYSTTVEDKLRIDILYVRSYSLVLDIKILFQTIRVVLQRDQAQGVQQMDEKQKNRLQDAFRYSKTV